MSTRTITVSAAFQGVYTVSAIGANEAWLTVEVKSACDIYTLSIHAPLVRPAIFIDSTPVVWTTLTLATNLLVWTVAVVGTALIHLT